MKIILVGARGAVGKAAADALAANNEIIAVGRGSGDLRVDIEDIDSVRALYRETGPVDAVVSAVGHGHFGPLAEMSGEQFMQGILHKVLPQVNLVLEGIAHVNDGGSFTLTSGVLNRDPVRGAASAAASNGALDGFVRGAAVDLPRGIRINCVSPEILEASRARFAGVFNGHCHVSDEAVGRAFVKAVEGCLTGQVFTVDFG